MACTHCEHSVACPHKYFFPPHPAMFFPFLRWPTSTSAVSPVLFPTNVIASSNTVSGAALMILSVWVLPPLAPPTPLNVALMYLSLLVGGGGLVGYLGPLAHLQLRRPAVSVRPGGVVILLIPGPPCVPPTFLSMSNWWVGMELWPGPPFKPPSPPWFLLCPWNTNHPIYSNPNVLRKIPGHWLTLILPQFLLQK